MKFGIVIFPGSNCDHDCHHVITNVLGEEAIFLWHKETYLQGVDCVVLPGGFSYGDYLRSGAMAACAPIMKSVRDYAASGGLVFGICNGFQILQEARLLPGALMRNKSLSFICKDLFVRVENNETPFTFSNRRNEVLKIPIAHMDGSFFLEPRGLEKLKQNNQIILRYATASGDLDDDANPNGSVESIAGICNETKNVFGLMPHPERCSEEMLGNRDGFKIWESLLQWNKQHR
ncbi:MAG: phosphoribosylformylglycinamidine synthase I [Deltaproteobacteria bacterium RIFCSPLOWO2_02_FULL_44_10]|nr:MAG: phosphoribosylformylglycinamidine synthase I [Deltaproteobacteria bacterium RIFCSPHIGHO2_02_FULL_44_16]OGQ46778.1 MAG: phosphoribosylformylglycinamidine synthase I [Deltaproteobacteria bacterium RIFCSPLOWO2_02_FULL_44_10]